LLCIESRKLEPRERVFEVAPDPFDGVELWTLGRQEHETHVFREGQTLGGMRPTVVQQQAIQALRDGLRKGIDEELEHLSVQIRQLEEEAIACGRLDRAYGLHPAGGEPPAADGQ
jgi:hypothetical protein